MEYFASFNDQVFDDQIEALNGINSFDNNVDNDSGWEQTGPEQTFNDFREEY